MASGQYFKRQQLTSARLLSLVNIAGTYNNGSADNGVGATLTIGASSLVIDGFSLEESDRVCLSSQTNGFENGLYRASGVGTNVVLTRSEDFQEVSQIEAGYFWPIQTGVQHAGSSSYVIDPIPNKVGVDTVRIFSDQKLPSDDFIAFNINVENSLITGGGRITVLDGGSTNQYRIRYMYINAGGTAFFGGSRGFQIQVPGINWAVIPGASFEQNVLNFEWGRGTDFPYPSNPDNPINVISTAGADIEILHTPGGVNYAGGDVVLSGVANQIA